ncbi:3'-5' exonuclease [Stanieria cyanosphaera]|uniref:3'-5' exonuclease n=1 Tax=Stanieria cyanosphaera TaxID=102116 RepID=UPI0002F8A18E|nr:3'-5' exonuclease [Stanieria cyanosphaera]
MSLQVDRLCQELEQMSLNDAQTRFERIYPYLKRKEGNFRLIARIYSLETERVLAWLTVFSRGSRDYHFFLRERENYGDGSLEGGVEQSIRQWLKVEKAKAKPIITTSPHLPENLLTWFKPPRWDLDTDSSVIYESEIWLDQLSQTEIFAHSSIYYQIIEKIVENFATIGESTQWQHLKLYGQEDKYVLFSPLTFVDYLSQQIIFLIAPFNHHPFDRELAEIVDSLSIRGNGRNWLQNTNNLSLETLTNLAKRTYPSYLLAVPEMWLAIQQGNGVNLALSAEEKAILHSVSTTKTLPLFLNGRAGSGKSTMLFYLFAEYCDRHIKECYKSKQNLYKKPHPLFLTYNRGVAELARSKVFSLLESNYRFLADRNEFKPIPSITPFFKTFRSFLLNLLPTETKIFFREDNYISFHRFRQLCRRSWRNYSPEKCWLAIRTFIKGYYLDERDQYFTDEDYQEIPKKEKSLSVEEFQQIYRHVWRWYQNYTKENQLWDDQDLIRQVLHLKCYRPEYTAIFCDEAQDFTRLELKLIMGISVFSRYDLEQEQFIDSFPFAFAGDPLQTLNPTGFRWESLQAAFYNEILSILTPTKKLPLDKHFTELKCNYRSVASIVGLSNLIQLWRKFLFNYSEIKPQQARKFSQFVPQKFIIGQNISSTAIQTLLKDTLILIPWDEGGEKDFVLQDEILGKFLTEENQAEIPWNILSTTAAKGLEFKQVILYKFGECCPRGLLQLKTEPKEEEKYFLNKLYVAISRATERLFIIDSPRGEEKLWQYASDRNFLEEFLNLIEHSETKIDWQQQIQLVEIGINPQIIASDDLESLAQTFKQDGLNTENPESLKRAYQAYQQLGNQHQAIFCLAWFLKFTSSFVKAGKHFLTLKDVSEACDCFWRGMAWQELLNLLSSQENQAQSFSQYQSLIPLIKFLAENNLSVQTNSEIIKLETLLNFTEFLARELQQSKLPEYLYTTQGQIALKKYPKIIHKLLEQNYPLSLLQWQQIGLVLASYGEFTNREIEKNAAECFYHGKNYALALKFWEKVVNEPEKSCETKYYFAKARVTGLPDGIEYLAKAQAHQTIIYLWVKSGKPQAELWLKYLAPALEALQYWNQALIVYCWLDNIKKVQTCWQLISKDTKSISLFKKLLKYYISHQYWQEAIATMSSDLNPEIAQTPLKYYFIYLLSKSQLTPNQLNQNQKNLYLDFIQQNIINNSDWQKYLLSEQIKTTLTKIGYLHSN